MKKNSKKKLKKRLRKARKQALRKDASRVKARRVDGSRPLEAEPVLAQTEQEMAIALEGYDETSLARAKTHWFFGEWDQLAALDLEALATHPDRDRFALLAASAHQQLGDHDKARKYVRMALDWGCPNRVVAQVLIAGVHNSLGLAAALKQDESRIASHFEASISAIDTDDIALVRQARMIKKMNKLGLAKQANQVISGKLLAVDYKKERPTRLAEILNILKDEIGSISPNTTRIAESNTECVIGLLGAKEGDSVASVTIEQIWHSEPGEESDESGLKTHRSAVNEKISMAGSEYDITGYSDDCSVMRMIIRDGNYESWTHEILSGLIGEGDIVLDVGANIGVTSMLFSKLCGNGRVFAFEPLEENIELLKTNISSNELDNVEIIPFAVGSSICEISMITPSIEDGVDYGGSSISVENNSVSGNIVRQVPLDHWAESCGMGKVDFVKIDTEGYEYQVLKGMRRIIDKYLPSLMIEFFPEKLSKISNDEDVRLFDFLRNNFRCMYLINRESGNLVPIASHAELRALMLTGHGVEDLLAVNDLLDDASIDITMRKVYAGYGASVNEYDGINEFSCLNYYKDGWMSGKQSAVIAKINNSGVNLKIIVNTSVVEQDVSVLVDNAKYELHLDKDSNNKIIEVFFEEGMHTIFFDAEKESAASNYFNNEDPRMISVNYRLDMI